MAPRFVDSKSRNSGSRLQAGEIHLGQGFKAGAGKQIALHQADAHLPQAGHLFAGLDPLRQRGDLQLGKQGQRVAHYGLPGRGMVDAAQQVQEITKPER